MCDLSPTADNHSNQVTVPGPAKGTGDEGGWQPPSRHLDAEAGPPQPSNHDTMLVSTRTGGDGNRR
jgi:hypothetical protein